MTVVADLSVPTAKFALDETLRAAPDIHIEFERVVTHSQEWIMPFLWVSGDDLDTFNEEIHDDPTVREATLANTFNQDGDHRIVLYQLKWNDEVKRRINAIFDRSGTLVEAVGRQDCWELKVRFHNRNDLSTLQSHFEQAGTGFTVNRIYTPAKPRQPEFNVSAAQRDALVAALEHGYYDVPRRAKMEDIAADLNLSTNAFSERLRRGTSNLISTTLTLRDSLEETTEHDSSDAE